MIKKNIRKGTIILVVCVFSMIFCGCSDKASNPKNDNYQGDYHLIYGPIVLQDLKYYFFTYSTKSGERIDTSAGSDLRYRDLLFAAGGRVAVYTGTYYNNMRPGAKATWVTTYPEADTVAIKEGIGGARKLSLNSTESNLLLFGLKGFTILTFPSLDSIYQDTAGIMGGFLTTPDKMYYLDSAKDTIFTIDYSNPQSIKLGKTAMNISDSLKSKMATAVDYNNHLLYVLLANNFAGKSLIAVYDSDSLKLLKQLEVSVYLNGVSIYPGHDECFFFGSGLEWTYVNHIDKYSYRLNTLQPFLENSDVHTPDPFHPIHIEFTPDGKDMYILSGAALYGTPVMGINLNDKTMTNYIVYDSGRISTFRINPIEWAK